MSDLSDTQRWMQSAIVGPNPAHSAADVILPSSQMTGEERLAIYQRAYLARLVECLRAEFPMVCRALGQELFDEFAAAYLATHPSTSYTLADLGREFADYLAATHPRDETSAAWPEVLVDLATLEGITNEVFNGPGIEHDPQLDIGALAPETWDSRALSLAPCVRLLELRYPVHDYYRNLRTSADTPPPAAARTLLVVSRLDYSVRHHVASEPQFALLSALARGENLGDAIAAASNHFESVDELAARLHGWFEWLAIERLVVLGDIAKPQAVPTPLS